MSFSTDKEIIEVAKEVIKSLKRNLEWNSYYQSYLLNQISEKEFNAIEEKYAIDHKEEITEELINKIRIYLLYFNNEDFVPSDIATIFRITIDVADKILEDLYNKESYLFYRWKEK